jgi:hypothetical protein
MSAFAPLALDRKYRLVATERCLDEWRPEDGKLQFVRDPRLEVGLFTLIVDHTGWLWSGAFDSVPDYADRIERLLALREGCLGRA